MKYVLNAQQMRQADQGTIQGLGVPAEVLMERAAYALAQETLQLAKLAEMQETLQLAKPTEMQETQQFARPVEMLETLQYAKPAEIQTASNISILVFCGSGNNGGDGFAAARILREYGAKAQVVFVGNPSHMTPQCALEAEIWKRTGGVTWTWEQWRSGEGQKDAVRYREMSGMQVQRNRTAEPISVINPQKF